MRAQSLCSGIGALDLAMQAIGVQTVGYCEYDKWCGEVLQLRMASGHLDSAPIWRDLKTLDGYGLPTGVDLIYGGIPCQPHSTAGGRAGADDPRDLWPATRRLLGEVRPRVFFLENVAGFATRNGEQPAFAYSVLADLAALGYVGRAGIVKASDTGAPHSRARWFCLATLDQSDSQRRLHRSTEQHTTDRGKQAFGDLGSGEQSVADARHDRGSEQRQQQGERAALTRERGDKSLEHPKQCPAEATEESSVRLPEGVFASTEWAETHERPSDTGGALGASFPPHRLATEEWAAILRICSGLAPAIDGRLSPLFVEWLMGVPLFFTEVSHEQRFSTEGSAAGDTRRTVRGVRNDGGKDRAASPRLQPASQRQDSLHNLSRSGGAPYGAAEVEGDAGVPRLWGPLSIQALGTAYLCANGVPEGDWPSQCRETLARARSNQTLPGMWDYILAQATTGTELREAGMFICSEVNRRAFETENRRKRLAALGNAVVPAQVLLALNELLGATQGGPQCYGAVMEEDLEGRER